MKIKSIKKLKRHYTKFDIETKNHNLVANGIVVHNCNARFVVAPQLILGSYYEDQIYVGSRTNWKKESEKNLWWRALRNHPEIERFCRSNPGVVLYGEVYGANVQDMKYGKKDVHFRAFDIFKDHWLNVTEFLKTCEDYKIPTVPILALDTTFNYDKMVAMAEGPSTVEGADHCREGCVIKPMIEGWNEEIGRKILKIVGNAYYLRRKT